MIKVILNLLFKLWDFFTRGINKIIVSNIWKSTYGKCGKNVTIGRMCEFYGAKNLILGNSISIGSHCMFMCTRANIVIGDHVMFGPRVCMITGGHRIDLIGKYMDQIKNEEKSPKNDQNIIIEGDNWIGANSTILKGVTVGRGAVVAANAVVTKDVPPYSVVGGIPAKVLKMRFTEKEILQHEVLLKDM